MFDEFETDNIDLMKQNGVRHLRLKASVQKKKIFLFQAGDIVIEPGDLIQRNLSNGAQEVYEVVEPGFVETSAAFPRHYQMDVKRLGAPEAEKAVHNLTFNISGGNNILGSSHFTQINNLTVEKDDWTGLAEALKKIGVPSTEISNLKSAVNSDAKEASGKDGLGKHTSNWLAQSAEEAGKWTLKMGVEIAKAEIIKLVHGYYGIG
jgi:hypothetical protein